MGVRVFEETNFLLRAFHNPFLEHARVRALFDQLLDQDNELWISRQVIREYLVQTTSPRTFIQPISVETILEQLGTITSICEVADETETVTRMLTALVKSRPLHGKQIHDANIVATMLAHGVDTLVTINLDDFKRYTDHIKLISLEDDTN